MYLEKEKAEYMIDIKYKLYRKLLKVDPNKRINEIRFFLFKSYIKTWKVKCIYTNWFN